MGGSVCVYLHMFYMLHLSHEIRRCVWDNAICSILVYYKGVLPSKFIMYPHNLLRVSLYAAIHWGCKILKRATCSTKQYGVA